MALLAMVPLVVGAIWMVGLMHLFGMMLNVVNVIGIPLILGIGIDDGVHILHRFRLEGPGRLPVVFSSTGKAVVLTSITTMLAFGSLGFAAYRGLASLGITLFIGVGTALLATLCVLPPLLALIFGSGNGGVSGPPTTGNETE
jgi:predicted RND superfamily exporter protein